MKTQSKFLKLFLTVALVSANLSNFGFAGESEGSISIGTTLQTERDSTEIPLSLLSKKGIGQSAELPEDAQHIPVGERRISQAEHVSIQEKRAALVEEKIQMKSLQSNDDDELIAKKIYKTSHLGVFHRPIAITAMGNQVTLEDGSVWQIRDSDRIKTLDWLAGDNLLILPNHAWFSSYQYVILNQNTGAEVKVNLLLGPIYNGVYTHWIVAIDYFNQELCLEDGSVWTISSGDHGTMKKWMPNDTIIIGVNDAWFSSKPNILINVNMLNDVAAICEN